MFRRCVDELEGLEVRVRERLGPVALGPDDEHREEVGEPQQRQHQLGVRPRSVGHCRALQVAALDPSAQLVQSIQGLQLSWCQPVCVSFQLQVSVQQASSGTGWQFMFALTRSCSVLVQ